MHHEDFFLGVTLPDVEDLKALTPPYAGLAQTVRGKVLLDAVMNVESFIAARAATLRGFAAVSGVADEVFQASERAGGELSPFEKQAVGAYMRALMEVNGFKKTGKKGAIRHPAFTKGEIYVRAD